MLGKTSSLLDGAALGWTPGEVGLVHPLGFSRQDQPHPVLVTVLPDVGWESSEVPSHLCYNKSPDVWMLIHTKSSLKAFTCLWSESSLRTHLRPCKESLVTPALSLRVPVTEQCLGVVWSHCLLEIRVPPCPMVGGLFPASIANPSPE